MSDVVGSGWTQVTFLRTVGVGSPGRASLTPLSGGVGVLLESCSLSFSHLGTISPDDDLPDRGLFLVFGSFTPLLEPVASFFFARQLDPSEAASSNFLQLVLGYLDPVRLCCLDPGRRSIPGPFVCEDDLCCEDLVGFSGVMLLEEALDALRVCGRFLGEAAHRFTSPFFGLTPICRRKYMKRVGNK